MWASPYTVAVCLCWLAAVLPLVAAELSLSSTFSAKYAMTAVTLPPVQSQRGLTFLYNDSSTLLIGSNAFAVGVIRDTALHIVAFSGSASSAYGAYTPASYTGLTFAPQVNSRLAPPLVFSTDPQVAQLPYPYVSQSVQAVDVDNCDYATGLNFVPRSYKGAGNLIVACSDVSASPGPLLRLPYTVDRATGLLQFDTAGSVVLPTAVNEIDDLAFTPQRSPLLNRRSMFAAEGYNGPLVVYKCDTHGAINPATRRVFASGTSLLGITFDPLTSDLLVSTEDAGVLYIISGFK